MNDLLQFENKYWNDNKLVIGIDEAGRGPLAGPLVVAGVIFPIGFYHPDINDSKQLSEKKRVELFDVIIDNALEFDIEIVEPKIIDEFNIYRATQNSMSNIALTLSSNIVLTDAMPLDIDKNVTDIIKGDAKSISIAAASILAKVTRDRIMDEYDKEYPEFNFKKNKGYPTKEHLEVLYKIGPTKIHRYSYRPVFEASQPKLDI